MYKYKHRCTILCKIKKGKKMGNQEILRAYRLRKGFTQGQFAKILNVHRNTVANYESGRSEVPEMVKRRFEVIETKKTERTSKMITAIDTSQKDELINLQKEKIERLEQTIAKHKSTPIQSTVWDSLEYDYGVKLSLTFINFKMGRTILEVGNKERISEVLGYSIQEIDDFWDIGVLYTNFKAHPVDAIISKETKKEIDKQILSLPNIFEALKDMMGNHYIPQPITYICKDKSFIHSVAYNKVDWKNKIVESKVQFLLND